MPSLHHQHVLLLLLHELRAQLRRHLLELLLLGQHLLLLLLMQALHLHLLLLQVRGREARVGQAWLGERHTASQLLLHVLLMLLLLGYPRRQLPGLLLLQLLELRLPWRPQLLLLWLLSYVHLLLRVRLHLVWLQLRLLLRLHVRVLMWRLLCHAWPG